MLFFCCWCCENLVLLVRGVGVFKAVRVCRCSSECVFVTAQTETDKDTDRPQGKTEKSKSKKRERERERE